MKKVVIAVALTLISACAAASQSVIVIVDSIGANIAQGQASQHFLTLVSNERDVLFRVIGSPGSSLGNTDKTGFNNQSIVNAINLVSGYWGWYDRVIIQAGTNDFSRNVPLTDTTNALRRILNKVRADGKLASVLDPIYRDGENTPNELGNTLGSYRYTMAIVCRQEYGDVCQFVPKSTSGMGSLTDHYDSNEVAQGGRLHPNVTGNRKMADWIKAEIFPAPATLKK